MPRAEIGSLKGEKAKSNTPELNDSRFNDEV